MFEVRRLMIFGYFWSLQQSFASVITLKNRMILITLKHRRLQCIDYLRKYDLFVNHEFYVVTNRLPNDQNINCCLFLVLVYINP